MNTKLSFAERAKLATELLSKQPPITLEIAREQVRKLEEWSKENSERKKGR